MSQLRLAVLEEIKGGRSQSPGPAWRPGPSSSQEISSEGGTSSGALETHGLPLLPAQGGCAPPLLLSLPSLLSPFGSCGLSASDTLSSLSWSLSLLVPLLCSSCQPRSIRLPAADHAPWTKDPSAPPLPLQQERGLLPSRRTQTEEAFHPVWLPCSAAAGREWGL